MKGQCRFFLGSDSLSLRIQQGNQFMSHHDEGEQPSVEAREETWKQASGTSHGKPNFWVSRWFSWNGIFSWGEIGVVPAFEDRFQLLFLLKHSWEKGLHISPTISGERATFFPKQSIMLWDPSRTLYKSHCISSYEVRLRSGLVQLRMDWSRDFRSKTNHHLGGPENTRHLFGDFRFSLFIS